jgi:hypothetical protein
MNLRRLSIGEGDRVIPKGSLFHDQSLP